MMSISPPFVPTTMVSDGFDYRLLRFRFTDDPPDGTTLGAYAIPHREAKRCFQINAVNCFGPPGR